jgi:hypothetical protein
MVNSWQKTVRRLIRYLNLFPDQSGVLAVHGGGGTLGTGPVGIPRHHPWGDGAYVRSSSCWSADAA